MSTVSVSVAASPAKGCSSDQGSIQPAAIKSNVIGQTHTGYSSVRRLGLGFGMLYRVYTRSSRLNTVKRIHTSPSSYAQKQKPVPQTRRDSRPPVTEVAEEVVVDEPYGEQATLLSTR